MLLAPAAGAPPCSHGGREETGPLPSRLARPPHGHELHLGRQNELGGTCGHLHQVSGTPWPMASSHSGPCPRVAFFLSQFETPVGGPLWPLSIPVPGTSAGDTHLPGTSPASQLHCGLVLGTWAPSVSVPGRDGVSGQVHVASSSWCLGAAPLEVASLPLPVELAGAWTPSPFLHANCRPHRAAESPREPSVRLCAGAASARPRSSDQYNPRGPSSVQPSPV